MGKLLRINLTKGTFKEEKLRENFAEKFLGGRGIGAKIMYDEIGPDVQPLSSDNKLIIVTGPLTGTRIPGSARHIIHTRSPLTGVYLNTIAGGHFGQQIKHAGYDGLIIEGKADSPVYIQIFEDAKEIKDAKFVWGMPTDRTQEFIKEAIGETKASVACIGPAGENLVPMACVINERRAAGRGGAGAVFGSKNLKAIAVYGGEDVPITDEDAFDDALKETLNSIRTTPSLIARGYGSAAVTHIIQDRIGGFPTRNWQTGVFDAIDGIYPETWIPKYRVKKHGCPFCPIACGHIVVICEGPYAGAVTEGPEYETLYSFGSVCGNSCIESIIAADEICDKLGIDTIEAGVTIAFAMECYQRGILTKTETDGIDLRWGNHEAIIALLRKIAYKQGFAALLSEGVRRMCEKLGKGTERYAMHVKGLAMGGYDPRAVKGMGIGMAHAPRGGCHHNSTYTMYEEAMTPDADPLEIENKPLLVKDLTEKRMILDLAPLCMFLWPALRGLQLPLKLLTAVTGMHLSTNKLCEIGERVHNLERAYNVRLGITRKDDVLPERLLKEPLPEGPAKGHVWEMDILLDRFYELCGWDKATGIPTREKLESLGLKDVAEELEQLKLQR